MLKSLFGVLRVNSVTRNLRLMLLAMMVGPGFLIPIANRDEE